MDQFLLDITNVKSLEEAHILFTQNDLLKDTMPLFLKASKAKRSKCAQAIRSLKKRLHPVQICSKAQDLLTRHAAATSESDRQDLQTRYIQLSRELSESAQGVLYNKVCGLLDRHLAPILALEHGGGRSNRARRAKPASNVFTRNAGLSSGGKEKVCRNSTDLHGNMIGSDWDLGRDGAYDGLKVVILQEWDEFGQFDGSLPVKALQDKGFEVVHKFARTKSESPSVEDLANELEYASQVWLIAGSFPILSDGNLDVINSYWQKGLGVYIFGDNDPFYVDANRLLSRMHTGMVQSYSGVLERLSSDDTGPGFIPNHLLDTGTSALHQGENLLLSRMSQPSTTTIQLSGNIPGGCTVLERSSTDDTGPGFLPNHLLLTGITALFEGITVASLNNKKCTDLGFEEVLREHTNHLVVISREAMDGCGPVIVDGAFTKLFCHWQEGGSSRFVRNCACWLSTLSEKEIAEAALAVALDECKPPELSLKNAYSTDCSITLDNGPTALLASQLADVEQNTTDFSLDNNLALARRNMVLSSQPLKFDVAKLFLQQGRNPFTREPVAAILPLVSLSNSDNLQLISEIANNLFMGGRPMTRHSLNILLSVLEEMLHKQPDDRNALKYGIGQILRHAVSTPDMLKGVPGGPSVPLEQGLRNNITMTGEFVPLRKAFPHVARIVRLLASHASEPRLPVGTLRQVARRSLLKTLIGAAGRYAKLEDTMDDSGHLVDRLKKELDMLLYDNHLGIPIGGTAKVIELSSLQGIVNKIIQHTTMDEIVEDTRRVAKALGVTDGIVSESELTLVVLLLRSRSGSLWKQLIEPLLVDLQKDPLFSEIWKTTTDSNAVDASTALRLANQQLTGPFQNEMAEHAIFPWPGFASPLGPSVYRCKCGFVFGNPEHELTDKTIGKLKQARNRHFQEMYGADGNGYPTGTSVHFPLHRSVQRVLTMQQFKGVKERNADMELAVATYLQKKKRGNIHVSTIRSDIQFAIDTYLECRKKGMAEPHPNEPIDFLKKAQLERQLILESRAEGKGQWVDPQRPVKDLW